MDTARRSRRLRRVLTATFAAAALARSGAAQVVVEAAPAGVSVRIPAAIAAGGAAAAPSRAMLLAPADFLRNLVYQLGQSYPESDGLSGARTPRTLPQAIEDLSVSSKILPRDETVATQSILVQALSNPRVYAAIDRHLRTAYSNPARPGHAVYRSIGQDAAEKLARAAAGVRNDRAQAELARYSRRLEGVLAASLAGDDREFARLFDGLLAEGAPPAVQLYEPAALAPVYRRLAANVRWDRGAQAARVADAAALAALLRAHPNAPYEGAGSLRRLWLFLTGRAPAYAVDDFLWKLKRFFA